MDAELGQVPLETGNSVEDRLIKIRKRLVQSLAILFVLFCVIYYIGQRPTGVGTPSIPDQAVTQAEDAVKADPNNLDLRVALANAYATAKRTDDALSQLDAVLEVAPKNRPALLGKGILLWRSGSLDEAKKYLQHVVRVSGGGEFSSADPQLSLTYYALGDISEKQGNWKNASGYLSKALMIDNSDADGWYELGLAQIQLNKNKEAAVSFIRALAFVPTGWCEPYDGMAEAYANANNEPGSTYAQAMRDICGGAGLSAAEPLKTLVNGDFKIQALLGLGQAASNDKNTEEAIKWYNEVKKIDPTNIVANNALGELQMLASPSA